MSKPVRTPFTQFTQFTRFIPGPGLVGLACAVCATVAIGQLQLLDGAAGRSFVAALVLLFYMVFCFVIFVSHRRKQQAASAWQNSDASQAGEASKEVLIAFASQTGFAEQLAQQTAQALKGAGMQVRACSLAQLDLAQLQAVRRVLFVVSTTGEGDAPDSAAGFARKVMGQVMGQTATLPDLHYGVLALGDRSYMQYCAFGHALDTWLRHHGAHAMFDMVEVDNGDTGALRHWQHHLGVLSGHTDMADWSAPGYERWILSERRLLNPGSAGGAAFHLSFKPADARQSLSWQAGDIAEIGPRNDPARVRALLDILQLDGSVRAQDEALGDVLARSVLPHDVAELASWQGMTAQALVDNLKPLPHREYSIASLPQDGQLELLVRQTLLPDGNLGLGSGWLTAHLAEQGELDLRVRPNRGFHPPADDCPLILIGNGTGLAGLRAHMKARIALGRHRNWLLFGERSVRHDFFHHGEIEGWRAQGMLERLDLAFSRDQAQRIYVQDRLRESAHLLQQWVDDGAAIYVCGSLEGMAGGVAQALSEILGEDVLETMAEQGRYRRDVY